VKAPAIILRRNVEAASLKPPKKKAASVVSVSSKLVAFDVLER